MTKEFKYQVLVYHSNGKVTELFKDKKSDAEALQLELVSKPLVVEGVAYSPANIVKVTIKEMEK